MVSWFEIILFIAGGIVGFLICHYFRYSREQVWDEEEEEEEPSSLKKLEAKCDAEFTEIWDVIDNTLQPLAKSIKQRNKRIEQTEENINKHNPKFLGGKR